MERRTSRRNAAGLVVLGLALGGAATALATRAVVIAGAVGSPAARVDDWVELVIVGGAAVAAAWVALGALLGLAVVTAARAGVRWRAGERAVGRLAPGFVRRLVRAGIGVSVGAGLALAPTAALAAPAAPAPQAAVTVSAASGEASGSDETAALPPYDGPQEAVATAGGIGVGVDLTWQPTTPPRVVAERTPDVSDATAEAEDAAAAPKAGSAAMPEVPPVVASPAAPAVVASPAVAPREPAPADAAPANPASVAPDPAIAAALAAPPATTAPPGHAAPAPAPRPLATPAADDAVVVLRGDTLWSIAERWLGGTPSDAEVMAATVRWHEANRAVIGDDADVLLPGQVLSPPA